MKQSRPAATSFPHLSNTQSKRRDSVKGMTLAVAVAVAIIGCVLAVSANINAMKIQDTLKEERYKRISTEQQLQAAENTISSLNTDLNKAQNKINGIQQIVNQGQTSNSDLKTQLEQTAKEKELLQQQLQTMQAGQAVVPQQLKF